MCACLFYVNCFCTPECQVGTPPRFLCTGHKGTVNGQFHCGGLRGVEDDEMTQDG